MMSVQIFMLALVFLGTLNKQLPVCKYNSKGDILPGQSGCYNLQPVFKWIIRCIISIFLVFWIAFVPLFVQGRLLLPLTFRKLMPLAELTERGTGRAILRLCKHFLSLSPVFEVFSTQIYMHSILNNLTFGGARYIATGRGFATTRISFSILYSRFAGPSIYLGLRTLILLLYITMSVFVPHLIYFWITVVGLCVAPFLFNPHQFSYTDFIIDYREFLRWMSRGNSRTHANSWVGYCRLSRTRITGFKRKRLGLPSEKLSSDMPRAPWKAIVVGEIIGPICLAALFVICYLFVKSFAVDGQVQPGLLRIAIIALGPIVFNMALLAVLFLISIFLGPCVSSVAKTQDTVADPGHS